MAHDGLGYAPKRDEGGGVSLSNPGALMHLPRVGDKVFVQGIHDLVFVLRVIVQDGEVPQVYGDEHGGRTEFAGLLLQELL